MMRHEVYREHLIEAERGGFWATFYGPSSEQQLSSGPFADEHAALSAAREHIDHEVELLELEAENS